MKGQKILVNGLKLYYEQVGNGPHVVLLCPGILGCTESDFFHQINGLSRKLFTITAWDPPGFGHSRPPERQFAEDSVGVYTDAEHAAALMKELGYSKYSVIGWSFGGLSAIVLAAKYPERVRKLVFWGCRTFSTPKEVAFYKKNGGVLPAKLGSMARYVEVYGEEKYRMMWRKVIEAYVQRCESGETDVCSKKLKLIQCPTLILHGEKDRVVPQFHAEYNYKNIKNSRLEIWKGAKHNLHIEFHQRFNKVVEEFLCYDTPRL